MKKGEICFDSLNWKSKTLLSIIRFLYKIVDIFVAEKWKYPIRNFEENPRTMSWIDVVYLGYKYLYKPHVKATKNADLERHFKTQEIKFTLPKGITQKRKITMHVGGDMYPSTYMNTSSCKYLRNDIGDRFFDSDIVVANLETPIDITKKPIYQPQLMIGKVISNASQDFMDMITLKGKYGFDVLLTANNHTLDMGIPGHKNTLAYLRKNHITYVGSRDKITDNTYTIIKKNGINVAFINYTFSLNDNLLSPDQQRRINHIRLNKPDTDISYIIKQVGQAKKEGADIIVLAAHMGNAYQVYPSAHIVHMMHRLFSESGVDIIIGGQPHEPQPMETYSFRDPYTKTEKKGFVIYGLGDLVSYDIVGRCHLSMALELEITQGKKEKETITQLTKVGVLPTYMCAYKQQDMNMFRIFPLYKILKDIQKNRAPGYITKQHIKEIYSLQYYIKKYFLPKNGEEIVLQKIKK